MEYLDLHLEIKLIFEELADPDHPMAVIMIVPDEKEKPSRHSFAFR
ncbi:MAG: hypothetical protein ACLVAU_13245 [Ruminococcus sp.]